MPESVHEIAQARLALLEKCLAKRARPMFRVVHTRLNMLKNHIQALMEFMPNLEYAPVIIPLMRRVLRIFCNLVCAPRVDEALRDAQRLTNKALDVAILLMDDLLEVDVSTSHLDMITETLVLMLDHQHALLLTFSNPEDQTFSV